MDRAFILSEIRRCAEASGGLPPGKVRFEAETGIPESESFWASRYWARWGDALREAGFDPNVMQQPYSDDHLLQHLAVVTRELGRFPTNAELRIRRRQDSRFPSPNVFGRLGNKRQLVSRLASFSESHDGLDDVRAICLATTAVATKADEPDEEAERRVRDLMPTGVVYRLFAMKRGAR